MVTASAVWFGRPVMGRGQEVEVWDVGQEAPPKAVIMRAAGKTG
jgi:hypothetical protein